jgi:hypothetical protein
MNLSSGGRSNGATLGSVRLPAAAGVKMASPPLEPHPTAVTVNAPAARAVPARMRNAEVSRLVGDPSPVKWFA